MTVVDGFSVTNAGEQSIVFQVVHARFIALELPGLFALVVEYRVFQDPRTTLGSDDIVFDIIETASQTVGIVVDSVAEVVDIYAEEIETAPKVGNDETARYIEGVVSRGEELFILVDLNKLLTDPGFSFVPIPFRLCSDGSNSNLPLTKLAIP